MDKQQYISSLEHTWKTGSRWKGVTRPYTAGDVYRLRGSIDIEYSLARFGAARLWQLFQDDDYVAVLSAITGNQAIQQVQAGLKAIYVSGWQVAADANNALEMYPDQSLYPSDSVPALLRRLNNALKRADEIAHMKADDSTYWFAPLVADAEAGFGGPLHAFEIMKNMIDAGAAGVHFEDQLASVKKCGHLGGKVLVPTSEFITKLVAARLATDVCGVDTILIARTDANSATLLTSDCDEYDQRFVTGERTAEGFFRVRDGVDAAIARALAYAPYADLLWFETSKPDLGEATKFAEAIHAKYPGKMLAYNCSPSFNWRKHLSEAQIAAFQKELQIPVRDPVRFPRAEPQHVRAGARVQGQGDGRILGAADSRVRLGEGRLRGGAAPRIRGRRLLRRNHPDRDRWAVVGDRDGGVDGAAAVPRAVARAPEGSREAVDRSATCNTESRVARAARLSYFGVMKRSTLYSVAAVLAVAALFFFMTTARAKVQCRVCMEFRGRTNCAAAVGPTEQAAREGAQSTACGPIASGMDEQIGCGRTAPASVQCGPK
jgi:isocitrate lyase